MFKGKFSLLFFLTFSVTFLFFFNTTNEASSSLEKDVSALLLPPTDIMDRIKAGPGVDNPKEKRTKLAEKIISEYAELKTIFEDESSPQLGNKMAKILGKKATLVVGSDKYHGKKEIKDFWNGIDKDQYQHVDFTLEWAFIVFEEMAEMEDYDHMAYEYFTFKLTTDQSEGKILKNQDGKGGRSCRHIYGCECRTR